MSSDRLLAPVMCPASWRRVHLREIAAKIGSGATPRGGQSAYQHVRTNFALVRSQNVLDRAFSTEGLAYISDEQAEGLRNVRLLQGDLLLNITGDGVTFGRACMVDASILPACVNQHVSIIRVDPRYADAGFVLSYLTHPAVKSYIEAFNSGGSRRAITKGHIESFVVPLPPRRVQREIAEILGSLDDRMALLRETNATLEAIAQALFKSWFVDFDPVRAKAEGRAPEGMDEATAALFPDEFEVSELGIVPKGWRVAAIADVVGGIFDGPHATPPDADSGAVFLGIKNLTGTGLDLGEIRYISEDDYARWTKRVTPREGDIVFSYEATLGFFALMPDGLRCCLGRRLALIRPEQDGHGYFWFHQLVAPPFQRLLDKHTIHGATVNRIALKEFPRYPVLNPNDATKAAFDEVAGPLWRRIHANQAAAQTLTSLRDTLLPRLISGRLRIPEAERELDEALA